MTILNGIPVKGMAPDFLDGNKMKKAIWNYVLLGNSNELRALVRFNDNQGRGLGGACFVQLGQITIKGYLFSVELVKPYKYQTQKNKREF